MPTIGVLLTGNPDPEVFLNDFRNALREVGYADGQNIRLEVRSAEGKSILLPEKAAELVRLKVDIIVASLTPAIQAAKQATNDIPIVMAPAGEPVGTGLVASLVSGFGFGRGLGFGFCVGFGFRNARFALSGRLAESGRGARGHMFEPVYAFQPGRWGRSGEELTSTFKRALIAIGESAPIRDR